MKTRHIIPQLAEFWGVSIAKPSQTGIQYWHLNDDPHDPENWRLIALRFPDLAPLLPGHHVGGSKPVTIGSESQLQRDLKAVEHLSSGASLADIGEALFDDRSPGGSRYKRVKAVKQALKAA